MMTTLRRWARLLVIPVIAMYLGVRVGFDLFVEMWKEAYQQNY